MSGRWVTRMGRHHERVERRVRGSIGGWEGLLGDVVVALALVALVCAVIVAGLVVWALEAPLDYVP